MFKVFFPLIAVAALLSGCSITSSRTVVEFDGSKTNYSELDKLKKGQACLSTVLIFPTTFDKSVSTAAKNGGISKVAHVDQVYNEGFLGLTRENCTVVYGN
ncbi:MAG: TRL-like family protein [Gammaproteobacteria bacterium]|nr:TRL-like family protein [Gammaproteobacteria bacterium]